MTRVIAVLAIVASAVLVVYGSPLGSAEVKLHISPDMNDDDNPQAFKVKLNALDKDFDLNLRKVNVEKDQAVLSPDIHFLIGDVDTNGNTVFHKWTPSEADVASAHDFYVDSKAKAAFRVDDLEGEYRMNGVVGGISIQHNGIDHVASAMETPRLDYINVETSNLTYYGATHSKSKMQLQQTATNDAIVELLLVCDKEFSDKFGQNYQRILEYFTVFMWDVNMRYKTIPSVNISWRVNGIVVISTIQTFQNTGAQPFIEQSRAADGRVSHNRVLDKFSYWVYQQRNNLPPFDLASVVSNARQEWGGGLAYVGTACAVDERQGRNYGTSVWNDGGDWGPLNIVAHELGHNMGAPHDDDPNYPGGCSVGSSYIMGGSSNDHRYFFSSCSDRTIGNFVKSDRASCLRTLRSNNPAINPEFSTPLPPTMTEQCKRRTNNQRASVDEGPNNCKSATCKWPGDNGVTFSTGFPPLDNSPCGGGGRCFRGTCRQPGYLFKNVGSGLCMKATNNFDKMAPVVMQNCLSVGNPLDRFVVVQGTKGTYLETPYIADGSRSVDKCTYTGGGEGAGISTDTCGDHTSSNDNPWHGWELRDAGNGQFLLYHKMTRRCAKPVNRSAGSAIGTYGACEMSTADYKWTCHL